MKKKVLSMLLVLAVTLTLLPTALSAEYEDTGDHWAESSIDRWAGADVVHGEGGNLFNPDGRMTRAEAAQVFTNLLHLTERADISRFADVPADAWYADPVAKCVHAGIMVGTSGCTISPDENLSREQLFTMVCRSLGISESDSAAGSFSDSGEVSGFARGFVNTLVNLGMLKGVGGNRLEPQGEIDRASVMAVLDRVIGRYITEDGTYTVAENGVTLVVAERVRLTGEISGLPIVVAGEAKHVDLDGVTAAEGAAIIVSVTADNVAIKNAPAGTAVTAAGNVSGTTVNGKGIEGGSTITAELPGDPVPQPSVWQPSEPCPSEPGPSEPGPSEPGPSEPSPPEPGPDAPAYTREALEKAVVEMAWDYYMKGGKIQYCSQDINRDFNKYYGATYRLTEDAPPEYGTSDTTIYSVCSDFVYKVYHEAMGDWSGEILGAAEPLEYVTTIIWQTCEDTALMRWVRSGYTMTDEDKRFGATEDKILSTEGARAFLTNWEENLRPGDVLLPAGHAMLYIGGGYVLDCWGSKYGFKTTGLEAFEPAGSVHILHRIEDVFLSGTDPVTKKGFCIADDAAQDYFVALRPLDRILASDGDADPGNDPVKDSTFALPDAMRSRLSYPAMEIDRTVDITPYGTTCTTDKLTYTVAVSNCSNESNYATYYSEAVRPAYSGTDYSGLTVTETVPDGTQLVAGSISHNGIYENGVITWTLDLAAGASVRLTYQVSVTAGAGSTIINAGGYVANIPSNSIATAVGGSKLSAQALAGLTEFSNTPAADWRAKYNISRLGTDLEFAERVYAKAMGIDLELPTVQEIVSNLFTYRERTLVSNYRRDNGSKTVSVFTVNETVPAGYEAAAAMLVGDYVGGSRVYFPERGRTINEFSFDYLEPGDILVYADTDSSGNVTSTQVAVYPGGLTLLILSSDGQSGVLTGSRASNSNPAFAKLWEAFTHHIFFVLRPSKAYADVSALTYGGENEPVYGDEPAGSGEGSQWEGKALSEENLTRLAAVTAEAAPESRNTAFAEDVYTSIGMDITAVTGKKTAVNILKALFSISNLPSGYRYELFAGPPQGSERLRAALVTDLMGGEGMVGYEDNRITADRLEPGDIFYLVNRTDGRYWVGVCLAEDRLLFSEYWGDGAKGYQRVNHLDLSGDTDGSAFQGLLAGADDTPWECYFVLRPRLGFDDINDFGKAPVYDDSADVRAPAYNTMPDDEAKESFLVLAGQDQLEHFKDFSTNHTSFAAEVYFQAGFDISGLMSVIKADGTASPASTANLYNTLFVTRDSQYYLNADCTEAFAGTLVPQLRGGAKMANAVSIKTDLDLGDLWPGDILVQAVYGRAYYTSVYLGDGKLLTRQLHPNGIAYTVSGKAADKGDSFKNTVLYDFNADGTDGVIFTDILKIDPQSNVKFDLYFVLRPCQTVESMEKLKKEESGSQGGEDLGEHEPGGETGSKPLNEDNRQKLLALAEENVNAWTKTNTAFAEEVYQAIGLDLSQLLGGATAASIRSALFTQDKTSKKYAVNPDSTASYAPALAAGLWGGTKMAQSADFDHTDLEPGDILYQLYATTSVYYVSVYLGDGKMLTRQYHKSGIEYTKGATAEQGSAFYQTVLYDFSADSTENAAFADILKTDPLSGKAFEYCFVLRPYLAAEDINSLTK